VSVSLSLRFSGLSKGSGISDGSLLGVNVGHGSSGSSYSEVLSYGLVSCVVSNVTSPGIGGNKSLFPFSFDRVIVFGFEGESILILGSD